MILCRAWLGAHRTCHDFCSAFLYWAVNPEVLHVFHRCLLCLFTGTEETWHFPAGGQWQQSYHRFNRAKNHQEQVGFLHPLVLLHAVQLVWGLINGIKQEGKGYLKGTEEGNSELVLHLPKLCCVNYTTLECDSQHVLLFFLLLYQWKNSLAVFLRI